MLPQNLTNKEYLRLIESATEVVRASKYMPKEQMESYVGLYANYIGFYGQYNGADIRALKEHQRTFNSDEDITIVIEGRVELASTPINEGAGDLTLTGFGYLLVNDAVVYDGRAGNGGGPGTVDWGQIGGSLNNQTDLKNALDGKANVVHTHTESDITDLDKYTQSEVDNLLGDKADTNHTHDAADVVSGQFDDARISSSSVTQHEDDLTITESQVSDLDKYTQAEVNTLLNDKLDVSEKGQSNGVAELDGNGKVPASQLPNSVQGGIRIIGFWNAATNTPDLSTLSPSEGEAYQVSVSGSTNINGETNWKFKDLVVWDDDLAGNWFKIDNTDDVQSVFGRTGPVQAAAGDYDISQIDNAGALASLDEVDTNEIADEAVTNSKLANVLGETFKGRFDSSIGQPQDMTPAQARSILNVEDGANNYVHPNHTGDVASSGDGATTAQPVLISGKGFNGTMTGTEEVLINNGGTLQKTTTAAIAALVAIGNDPNAVHVNVAGEIAGIAQVTAASGDYVIIEDASDSFNKKRVNVSDFLGSISSFDDLSDTPANKTGQALNLIRVNAGQTGLEYITPGALYLLNTVGTSEINNAAITNQKLASVPANTVKGRATTTGTPTDLSMTTLKSMLNYSIDDLIGASNQGDILYYNGSTWTRLVPGTAGNVLQTNGPGANPTWVAPSGGGGGGVGILSSFPLASVATGTASANTVYYVRFLCPADIDVNEMSCFVTSVGTDTISFGIYSDGGTLLGTTAPTTTAGWTVGSINKVPLTSTTSLVGGQAYYFALKCTIGTLNFGTQGVFTNSSIAQSQFFGSAGLPSVQGGTATSVGVYINVHN